MGFDRIQRTSGMRAFCWRGLLQWTSTVLTLGALFIVTSRAYCQSIPTLSTSSRTEQALQDTDPFDTGSIDDLVSSCEQELQRAVRVALVQAEEGHATRGRSSEETPSH